MTDPDRASWTEDLDGRERIRRVVEVLEEPTTVRAIAERADVSRATAADELGRLASDDWVTETTVDGTRAYDLNPVRMLFDEITDLVEGHTRDELEDRLVELTEEREALADEFGADSLEEFRTHLADSDLSAQELRERRNVIETWESIETERNLVRHALQLYGDVTELGSPNDAPSSPV
jgi:transposase